MLVSTALIIFIMTILASVFTAGLSALRTLRGVGHMQDHLRMATNILRRDLAAPHFGRETTALQGAYLSQQRLDLYDWKPPKQGYFRIYQGAPSSTAEGPDGDGIFSYTMGTPSPALQFTVRFDPNTAQGTARDRLFFTNSLDILNDATMPPLQNLYNQIRSYSTAGSPQMHLANSDSSLYTPWMEVAYFVEPTGQTAGSTPLFTLYRRRRLLLDIKPPATAATMAIPYQSGSKVIVPQLIDVSLYEPQPGNPGGSAYLNTPADVASPYRRLDMSPLPTGAISPNSPPAAAAGVFAAGSAYRSLNDDNPSISGPGGDDILLENVISFDIKATWDVPTDPRLINRAAAPLPYYTNTGAVQNPDYPFDNLPVAVTGFGNSVLTTGTARVFDTWRGEDYATLGGTVPYSLWSARYEGGGANTDSRIPVTIPLRIRVKAIQIRLRVWDTKTQQARQVTMVQDL